MEYLTDGLQFWRLHNHSGATLTLLNLGATVAALEVPDRHGKLANVALGYADMEGYRENSAYFGAVVGRYANRISGGRFEVDGIVYRVPVNDGKHALHGGTQGFHQHFWSGEHIDTADGQAVRFSRLSVDGEAGFPGEVATVVTYCWSGDNRLIVDFEAVASRPTPLNITQHSYWNLAGAKCGMTVLDHALQVDADCYLPVDNELIPTGEMRAVDGSVFDLRHPTAIGVALTKTDGQTAIAGGFDHNWVLNGQRFREVASLYHAASGRLLTLSTDQPGLQIYSGNGLDDGFVRHGGIAMETQHFPDSPNHSHFPDTILRPGKPFKSRTVFAFSCQ